MKKDLIPRLQSCLELHLQAAGKYRIKGNADNADMHEVHGSALNEAISELTKKTIPKRDAVIPTKEESESYAGEIRMPKVEADKFYDHFESNGWKVGGKSAMKSWQAAMRNWRRNWAEKNPVAARNMAPATKKPQGDPAGWEDWLLSKNMPARRYGEGSGWMKEEFNAWMKGPQE